MVNDMQVIGNLEAGIRAEGARQKVIANNLANINTPGYRRYELKFEDFLKKAIDSGKDPDAADLKPEVYQPFNTALKANMNDVSLDQEVGQLIKNSLKHQAYTSLLKKKYEQMKAAIQL